MSTPPQNRILCGTYSLFDLSTPFLNLATSTGVASKSGGTLPEGYLLDVWDGTTIDMTVSCTYILLPQPLSQWLRHFPSYHVIYTSKIHRATHRTLSHLCIQPLFTGTFRIKPAICVSNVTGSDTWGEDWYFTALFFLLL